MPASQPHDPSGKPLPPHAAPDGHARRLARASRRSRDAARTMSRFQARRPTQPGLPPGTLVPPPGAAPPRISLIAYTSAELIEKSDLRPSDLLSWRNWGGVVWINVDGIGDSAVLRTLGEMFQLHPLALEDAVNGHQRAKVEHYAHHEFVVSHMIALRSVEPVEDRRRHRLEIEQLSLFLGDNFVVTMQEDPRGDCLDPVRARIRSEAGVLRRSGPDQLMYAILDAIVDHYFPLLEAFGERLEDLENEIIENPTYATLADVHETKRELLNLRRAAWPLRDALSSLQRDPIRRIQDETRVYLRDCHDHVVRIIDLIETYRELGSDLIDMQYSSLGQRTNEVMRVLTVISSIFIPLTFVVGIYGMNFDTASPYNMPELRWRYGYPMVMAAMTALAVAMVWIFYRAGWIGRK